MRSFASCLKFMKKAFYILSLSILFISCSDFQKALKSDDIAEKYKMGTELFDAGKYNKAFKLLDQILASYRGKPQAEKLTYMHAMCSYKLGDYYIASYHFDKFSENSLGKAWPITEITPDPPAKATPRAKSSSPDKIKKSSGLVLNNS